MKNLKILFISVFLFAIFGIYLNSCSKRTVQASNIHHRILAKAKLGMTINEIEFLLNEEKVYSSSVVENLGTKTSPKSKELGELRKSGILNRKEKTFNGEITFFVSRPLLDGPVAIGLSFKQGILVKKDWGYLPG
jgi:hypothetical protein